MTSLARRSLYILYPQSWPLARDGPRAKATITNTSRARQRRRAEAGGGRGQEQHPAPQHWEGGGHQHPAPQCWRGHTQHTRSSIPGTSPSNPPLPAGSLRSWCPSRKAMGSGMGSGPAPAPRKAAPAARPGGAWGRQPRTGPSGTGKVRLCPVPLGAGKGQWGKKKYVKIGEGEKIRLKKPVKYNTASLQSYLQAQLWPWDPPPGVICPPTSGTRTPTSVRARGSGGCLWVFFVVFLFYLKPPAVQGPARPRATSAYIDLQSTGLPTSAVFQPFPIYLIKGPASREPAS